MKHILLILFVLLPWTLGFVVAQTLHDNVWVTNGPVNSIAHSDHSIYLGGYFTEVGPATGSFVSVNAVTGSRDTDFPKVIGTVTTTVSDGLGGWYIGGYFTRVGNYARTNLAHIKADKTVDEDFNISFSGYSYIYALAVSQTTLYVGGYFTSIGGVSRSHLASIDLTLGTVTSWEPNPNSQVLSLLVDGVYSRLYVGGYFITISGSTRNRFASYNIWDGSLNSINPNLNSAVFAMALSVTGDTIYMGGDFTLIGGATSRTRLASYKLSTSVVTSWNPSPNSIVLCLALSGSMIYVGGYFTTISSYSRNYLAAIDVLGNVQYWNPNPNEYGTVRSIGVTATKVYVGGDFTSVGGHGRNHLAALDKITGTASSWNPNFNSDVYVVAISGNSIFVGGIFSSVGGVQRNSLASIDASTGEPTSWNPDVVGGQALSLALSGSILYVSGEFSAIGLEARQNVAAIDVTTGIVTSWNPGCDGSAFSILPIGSSIYVGGDFSTIGGQSRVNLAAVDATTGNVSAWNPILDGPVHALALSGATLFVGGEFYTVGGITSRNMLASFDLTTGFLTSWNPNLDAGVFSLALSGTTVYAGGDFSMVGTTNRIGIAAIDATTGIATSWNANSDGVMRTVTVSGSTIYVGGYFTTIGGQSRSSIAALNATTGNATDWSANTDLSGVLSIVLRGQDLLIGGEFWSIKNTPHSYFSVISDTSMTLSGVYGIKYRTFTASEFGANINQKPMKRPYFPNTANVIQETYKKFPLAPIIVGKAFVYNNEGKLLAYIQPKAYTDVLKTFNKSGVTHTGTARGLDFDKKSAPLLKRWVTLDVTKHDNTLVANLLALKVNIVASDTGVTPNGLADLLYNEGSGNPLSGKSISEIADYAGDLMTNWRYLPLATFANLDTTIAKINAAFSGVFDTTQWIVGSKLVVKGTRELGKISFLQPNTSSFRHRVIPVSPEDVLPSSYSLEQNYPNPFNPTTTIQFELGQNSLVTLKIYNILGQEVATLLDRDELYEGQREVMFNGKELASGIYFYRLVAESIDDEGESSTEPFVQVKKMVLLK